jgi:hypothetical protein
MPSLPSQRIEIRVRQGAGRKLMVVHRLEARVRTRTVLVSYWPDLDGAPGSEIKLGVFGDLRMGKRYALGLIARTTAEPEEIERVGRLAKHLVEKPFKALREKYEEIWGAPSPQDAFERVLARTHSSLILSDAQEMIDATPVADLKEDLETTRTWCMDKLRPILRGRFHAWMGAAGAAPTDQREQLAERDEPQPDLARRVAG